MKSIPQMMPWFDEKEKEAVCNYMDEGGFITEYKHTTELENCIAKYTGSKHCIMVNNGTVSLTLAALAIGIEPGDEVLVPNYTMIATPNSVKMLGAIPVFVDVEPDTLCMDLALARKAITSRTKAILFVSANGRFPISGINEFVKLAKEYNIELIEDAAQSLGSYYPDGIGHVGTIGSIGSFSFSAPKIISTGQGGALITNSDQIASRIRRLKDFGRSGGGTDIHDSVGYNFKFTELQAVVGLSQMQKLHDRTIRKKKIWDRYYNNLFGIDGIKLFNHDLNWTVPWFIDSKVSQREELVSYLNKFGIGTRVMYPPINKQLAYSVDGIFPAAEEIGQSGLWLPSFTQIRDDEIDYVTSKIIDFYEG